MEPRTKKGLIIGGSIAAVVLIGASIGIGIASSSNGGQSTNIDGNKSIEVWGYNDQVSSTSMKVNKYMQATFTEMGDYWGGGTLDEDNPGVASAEGTLLKNSHYHPVDEDIQILDGVNGSQGAMGYLSSTWVGGYTDAKGNGDQFTMLKLYDNGVVDGVAPTEAPSRSDAANYLDPTDAADKVAYSEVNSIATTIEGQYVEADDGTVGEGTYDIYSESMQATLNATMKVTPEVANWIRGALTSGYVLTAPTATEVKAQSFVDWLNAEGYTDDFVVSYGLFLYMAYDTSNIEIVNGSAIPGSNASGIGELEEHSEILTDSYINLTGNETADLTADIIAQQNRTSGSYHINVDGTGTNSGIMKMEISNYQADVRTALGNDDIIFYYDLDNGGSGEAWATPKTDIGTEDNIILAGDPESSGRPDAFIGTSSRASKTSEIAKFGYAEDTASLPNGGSGDVYVSPEESTDGQILGYTMGIDLPVFFVNKDMTFNYTVTEASLPCIENATEAGVVVGDTITVRPTGMSDLGAKAIYEEEKTWTEVLDLGLILVEAV